MLRLFGHLAGALNRDFCPGANRYVYWLKQPIGWFVLAAAAALSIGVSVATPALVVFAAILTVILLGVAWPWIGLRGVSCRLRFEQRRTTEGSAVGVRLAVVNRWPWPVWGLTVEQSFSLSPANAVDEGTAACLARIPAWSQTTFRWDFEPECRGRYPRGVPRLACGFPFGIWHGHRPIFVENELVVWPRMASLTSVPPLCGRSLAVAGIANRSAGQEGDLSGVRLFRPGDSLRQVHWAQSAKYDRLVVCERQGTGRRQVRLILDLDSRAQPNGVGDASLENIIRVGALIARQFHAHYATIEVCFGRQIVRVDPGSAGLGSLLDGLATWSPGDESALDFSAGCERTRQTLFVVVTTDLAAGRWKGRLSGNPDAQFVVLRFGDGSDEMRANEDGEEAEASGAWRARRGSSLLALDGRDDVLGRLARMGADLPRRLVVRDCKYVGAAMKSNVKTDAGERTRSPAGDRVNRDRRASCLVLALLAAASFHVTRQWDQDQICKYAVDTFTVVGGWLGLFWMARRDRLRDPRLPPWLAVGLSGYVALPVFVEFLLRRSVGEGEAIEMVMLICLRNAELGTAALCGAAGRLSCVFSGFLTLFSISISDGHSAVYVPAAIFSGVGLWLLMGAYWDRVQGTFAVESRRQIPLRVGFLLAVCGILGVSAALVASTRQELWALPGFMPTSGGQHGSDPYARQGIGDGDMLAAAKDQAMTFGPVDSEQFLESDMPSLYDMLDDRYGEPAVKRRRARRAVALGGRNTSARPRNPSESKRSGREFAAARRKTRGQFSQPRSTNSKALVYVLGAVPVHLGLETYDAFDGTTWLHEADSPAKPPLAMNAASGKPWLEFPASPATWVLAQERHAVKIVNFRSPRYPSPPLLTAVNIDRVNRRDLFSWTADGVLQIEGHDTVPQFTVVHLVSNVLGAELVRQHGFREPVATQNAPYLQLPDVPSLAEIKRLAERWTRGIPTGWPQVEAIVEGLRNDFLHDEDAVAPEECGDVVGQFLQARRGPDYVFASAAALLLRSCGYPTRLVSGFYADSKRYDRRAGQTAVVTDDAHVWLEVGASRGTWVPVEPTPGYEPPRMVLTWLEFAWTLVRSLAKWSWKHSELVIGGTLLLSVAIRQRRRLVDAAASLVWRALLVGGPKRAVLGTVRLLECRARLAGCSRPESKTFAAWHEHWLERPAPPASEAALQVMSLIDWVLYAPRGAGELPVPATEVKRACRDAVRSASVQAMRQAWRGFCSLKERS